ncbi:hypothetical protein MTQ00_20815 [Chryseobacterium sp. B21-037]|uniref:hypothetical protein n=1 Tax=Chryseobacterium sp. B21-037 TaxID=2926038 RepID=UPI002359A8E1|nr:hypothetical protein [Chryseobacterium sp. B21-037]MDC8106946.1 hypothetical protein [Chryseobacterium sp. B21-037]
MKNYLSKTLSLFSVLLFLGSCTPLKTALNKKFPPVSTIDQQYTSVEKNLSELTDFSPHIGVNIDRDIILQYLPPEIKKAAEAINDENILVQNVTPKLSFDKQGIFVEADFSVRFPKYSIEATGNFKGVTAVSTKSDSLYLRSALTSLKIESIQFLKHPKISQKVLAKMLSPILKNYIDNVNGQIFKKPTIINIGWGQSYQLSLKEMFKNPDTEIIADSIRISRFVKKSSVRIQSTGVSIMAELTKEKPLINDLKSISQNKPRSEAELSKLFKLFSEKYDNLWLSVFEPIDAKSSVTANVSKAEISSIFNEAFSNPISLKQNFIIPQTSFNEKLEVKRGDINCQKVRTDFKYPDFNGPSCNWSCSRWDPICHSTRAACRVRREAQRVIWQTARETARIAHQVENEAKVAACNVWRETLDFLALGRFKGEISGNGKAFVHFQSLRFNPDLSEMSMQYYGNVDATLQSNLELKPVDLGHIFFCFSDYDKRVSSDIDISIPESVSKISITSAREGENLLLHIKPDDILYNASIQPSPLHSLLLDPKFQVQCPISVLLTLGQIGIAAGEFLNMVKLAPEQKLLLLGRTNGKYSIDSFRIPFKPIEFKINGVQKKSSVFWNSKSIQFTYLEPIL